MKTLVLDTNIVLDLLVFSDLATVPLQEALLAKEARWVATPEMREELSRVLAYPNIVGRLAFHGLMAQEVLERFDRWVQVCEPAPACALACRDRDDQKFIDLAVQHGAMLLSKDFEVLTMGRRLAAIGIAVASALPKTGPPAPSANTA